MYDTLEEAGIFDSIDSNLRNALRPFVKISQELGNKEFDKNQAAVNYHLKNFGGDDVGVFNLLPKETRQKFAFLAKIAADPLDALGD